MEKYINNNSNLKRGYNSYIDSSVNDMGTMMDVGLVILEDGDIWTYENPSKEMSALLFEGNVTFEFDRQVIEADRPDCFHYEAYCLLMSRKHKLWLLPV